jgi:hypothetical protein
MPTRPGYDWGDAFARLAALRPQERSYQRLADELGCAKRTVERAANRYGWTDRLDELDRQVAREAEKSAVRARGARVADTLRIIDAARTRFAGQLGVADFRLTGADFVGLIKLEQLLEGEATENVALAVVQAGFRESLAAAAELVSDLVERGVARSDLVRVFRAELPVRVQERLALIGGDSGA